MEINEDNIEDVLHDWEILEERRKSIIVSEKNLRNDIIAYLAPTDIEGTQRFPQSNMIAKIAVKYSYGFDVDLLLPTLEEMSELEKDAIAWKPALTMKKYRAISESSRELLDSVLTIKLAQPSLTLEYKGTDNEDT